jgi:hypothetical protein
MTRLNRNLAKKTSSKIAKLFLWDYILKHGNGDTSVYRITLPYTVSYTEFKDDLMIVDQILLYTLRDKKSKDYPRIVFRAIDNPVNGFHTLSVNLEEFLKLDMQHFANDSFIFNPCQCDCNNKCKWDTDYSYNCCDDCGRNYNFTDVIFETALLRYEIFKIKMWNKDNNDNNVKQLMEEIDKCKESIPNGNYLIMCNLLKKMFEKSR